MFQFPGFALKTLCIQVLSTWLCSLLIAKLTITNISGGLPHSEIHGSKLILSSPWLIAEYHVFHRLLLPRHSPNALFALDLIQKKSDLRLQITRWFTCYLFLWSKVILSRLNIYQCVQTVSSISVALVSVLDLDNSVHFNLAYEGRSRKQPDPNALHRKPCFTD